MTWSLFLDAFLLGCGATLFMDLVAWGQRRFLRQQTLDYALVGRLMGHAAGGQIIHRPIMGSDPVRFEGLLGWTAHYAIGIMFAWMFLLMVGEGWLVAPTFLPALAFGLASVVAPFFLLQPCMGAGLLARRTPNPTIARLKSLFAHAMFGIGLWVSGVGMGA